MSQDVTIVHRYPPNFEMIKAALPHANETHVYCYGDTIYVPDGHEVLPDIVYHESIHIPQQGKDPDAWWMRYLTDRKFRFEQELEAYGKQYQWICEHVQGAQFRAWALESMATALSGEAYGNLVDYHQAHTAIRRYGK